MFSKSSSGLGGNSLKTSFVHAHKQLISGKSMISWRSCDFLDRSKSRQIKGRNWRKSSTRSDFPKTLDVLMWFHGPLNSQGKPRAKWASRDDKKASLDRIFCRLPGFSLNLMKKVVHLSGRLKALRHFDDFFRNSWIYAIHFCGNAFRRRIKGSGRRPNSDENR